MKHSVFRHLKNSIQNLEIFKTLDNDTKEIENIAERFSKYDSVFVIGTGGSSLGSKCLVNFESKYYNKQSKITFLENVDSRTFQNAIENNDPQKTGIIIISKSGNTTEPLIIFETLRTVWNDFDFANNAVALTEFSENNLLRKLANNIGMDVIQHNPKIGGRFSVFSNVGLIPASISGVNIKHFLQGAKNVIDCIKKSETPDECSLFSDIFSMAEVFAKGTINQHVLFSYSDLMDDFGKWYTQLISESLGKNENFGITPIRAIGTVDQHSMLQLFLGGPRNKLYTVNTQNKNYETPQLSDSQIDMLNGHSIHDMMRIHQKSTIEALKSKAQVRVLNFEEINIETIGFLMMLAFVEVVVISMVANINPYDQPAVEEVKILVKKYLSQKGYY